MDLNQHDRDELRHAAWKAQATSSPHARVTVPIEADKLLWLLDVAEKKAQSALVLDSRPTLDEVEQALRDAEVPAALRADVMDLLF